MSTKQFRGANLSGKYSWVAKNRDDYSPNVVKWVLFAQKKDKTKAEVSDKLLSKQEKNIGFYYTKLRTIYKNATPEEFKKAFFTVMIEKLKIPQNKLKLPVMKREEFKID